MVHWLIVFAALVVSGLWAVMFLKQLRSGLAGTSLEDHFAWGLYVQGFFFFSALGGGVLLFMAVATLFEAASLRPLVEIGAAVSLGCLVAAGLLLGSDLGKPFRGIRILTGNNFASPLTWDFYMLSLCGVMDLVFLLDLVPEKGAAAVVWSVLSHAWRARVHHDPHPLFPLEGRGRLQVPALPRARHAGPQPLGRHGAHDAGSAALPG